MGHPQPDNRVRIGKLKNEPAAEGELRGLVRSTTRRFDDAAREELSLESRFDLAYNAARALALAALRFHGCPSDSRYLVFRCLQLTLDLPGEQWRVLDQAHRKRNLAAHEGEMAVDEQLVDALLRVTRDVAARVNDLARRGDDGERLNGPEAPTLRLPLAKLRRAARLQFLRLAAPA